VNLGGICCSVRIAILNINSFHQRLHEFILPGTNLAGVEFSEFYA